MGLKQYKAKRKLQRTPEPCGGKQAGPHALRFVVQRHKASHLHCDFRLEMDSVLKNWAAPKGPSLDSADKRLAMMVEDQPYDYKDFHGVIPEGNYGAGIVEIWDQGTYRPEDLPRGKDAEHVLQHALGKGSLKIELKGRKLKGGFALVHLNKGEGNSWLLIIHRDAHAVADYGSEEHTPARPPINKALAREGQGLNEADRSFQRSGKALRPHGGNVCGAPPVPRAVKLVLTTLSDTAFDDPGWIFEIKWYGYRAIAETGGKGLRLYSRNGLSFKEAYPAIMADLVRITEHTVLDGEISAMDDEGRPDFQLLQHAGSSPSTPLVYQVFDLLEHQGRDLRELPQIKRKEMLRAALADSDHVRYCDHVDGRGKAFFEAVERQDLEGMIAKWKDAPYREGKRSTAWLKVKHQRTQEVVIGGYTAPRDSRKYFGALLLGIHDKG